MFCLIRSPEVWRPSSNHLTASTALPLPSLFSSLMFFLSPTLSAIRLRSIDLYWPSPSLSLSSSLSPPSLSFPLPFSLSPLFYVGMGPTRNNTNAYRTMPLANRSSPLYQHKEPCSRAY